MSEPYLCGVVVNLADGEYLCCLPEGHEGEHDPDPWNPAAIPNALTRETP